MSDRFKFRTWLTESKEMLYDVYFDDIEVFGRDEEGDTVVLGDRVTESLFQHCILMQSTGIKDKNDKLIYEGDVVNGLNDTGIIEYGEWSWDSGWPYYGYGFPNDIDEGLEIIGNIYEDPELKKKCQS